VGGKGVRGIGHAGQDAARPGAVLAYGMPRILALAAAPTHGFSKAPAARLDLVAGLGVAGDAHQGATVKHRSRVARDPTQPNLRQVHLLHAELLAELATRGFDVPPGGLGENILTEGLDLLALPRGARLRIGAVELEVTGLRNPCAQIEAYRPGLLAAVLDRAPDGALIRKTGVMAVVLQGGGIAVGDAITVALPAQAEPLTPV
jgi:MOSC domain-containing protein YiiM